MRTFSYYINTFRVIDGDTLEANLDLGFHLSWDFNIRLNGLDAPEIHGVTKPVGDLVSQVVSLWLSGAGEMKVQSLSLDEKYGRLLAIIFDVYNNSLNDFLLRNQLALPYDGGTKLPWGKSQLDLATVNAMSILKNGISTR